MILNKQVHLIHLISIKHPKNNLFSIKLKFAVFLDSYLLCIILANSNFFLAFLANRRERIYHYHAR
jgi:hypothetical protein